MAGRLYGDELARILKVPILVVNRAGGSGVQGTTYVINGKKDGYILLAGSSTELVTVPAINKEVTYDPLKDLIPLGHFVFVPSFFAVRSDSPFKTFDELIGYARKNPGKLKNASTGLGTAAHFNLEILCAKSNIKITTIPFSSAGEAVTALLGGHVDMSSNSITIVGPQIKAGKLRALALSSKTRHPDFPDVPTAAELGHPDADFCVWFGAFAPKGVAQSVVDVLVPAMEKACKNPEVVQRATKVGFTAEYRNPEEFRQLLEAQIPMAKKIAQDARLSGK